MQREVGSIKNKAVAAAVLAAFIITAVGIGYFRDLRHAYEMTFLSNVLTAFVLLFSAVKIMLTGRDIPHFLYMDVTALLLTVVCVCAFFAPGATFCSPSVVLHLVDPVLVTAFYFTFCDARGVRYGSIATALVFPSLYYCFMIIFGRVTGSSVYPYFDTTAMSAAMLVWMAAIAETIMTALCFALIKINRHVRAKREARAQSADGGESAARA